VQRWLTRHFGEPVGSPILVNLLLPFGAYLVAERLHASGILAAVAAGITMSYVELSGHAMANTRIQRSAVWDTVQFALNGVMFVLLGEQLPDIFKGASLSLEESGHLNPWWLVVYAFAITGGLLLIRMAWVWASLRLTIFKQKVRHQPRHKINPRLLLATTLAGARGTITLAGVLTLPLALPDGSPFPARALTIFLACSVILISLLTASIALPRLLAGMTFPAEPEEQQEEDMARREAANAAITAIEKTQVTLMAAEACSDPEVYPQAAARVIAFYEHKLKEVDPDSEHSWRKTDYAEKELRLAALAAERHTVFDLARHDRISDAISRKLVREIDLMEARYR
jgi:NhaP-type Na+/H+ or K+/H+ antiporter